MNVKANQIIDELIKLDPSFATHRNELEKIILSVLAIKPEPVIDSDFVRNLRQNLLSEAAEDKRSSFWSFKKIPMKKTILAASAGMAMLIIALGLQSLGKFKTKNNSGVLSFGSDVRITHAQDSAFGNLATLTLATGMGGGGTQSSTLTSADQSKNSSMVSDMSVRGGVREKMIAPDYQPVSYKYIYKGDDLNLSSDKLDVLKKQTPDIGNLSDSLNLLDLGLVNLSSFSGSKVQSVSFNQTNGYNIYVDLTSGNVSISGYFDVMSMSSAKLCPVDGCPNPEPIKESDIPADDVLISTANAFLTEHGISSSGYGAPEVLQNFRSQIKAQMLMSPKSLVYWPESVDVVYPTKIGDGEVFDESGNKTGLVVSINIRNNKVTSVGNLSLQNYEASSYDAETDSGRIMKIVQRGGMYGYTGDPAGKTVEIELGTPTIQYVQMWDFQNNMQQQLLVPSLVFPVTKQPNDGSFYRQSVVIPLIKNILERDNGMNEPIRVMEGNEATDIPAIAPKSAPKSVK